jgi:hypothetical protein
MSHKKELQDLSIRAAISGCEDPKAPGVLIEENYFKRERRENLQASCLTSWRPHRPKMGMTEYEKEAWKAAAQFRALHDERYQKFEESKEAHLEPDYDEDKFEPYVIKIECPLFA